MRRVVLFRKRRGPDRRIGKSPPTSPDSRPGGFNDAERIWGVSARRRPGRYYAVLKERTLPDWGICASMTSSVKRIRRH